MKRVRTVRLLLACGLGLVFALAPVWAQDQSDLASSPETGAEELTYRELQLREQAAAERRLDIIQMRGEASRLTANTEELNAQAQNCKARRAAFEAGAPVDLCENDEPTGPPEGMDIAEFDGAPPSSWLAQIEERLGTLENQLRSPPNDESWATPGANSPNRFMTRSSGAVLLLTGPARAIVRLPGGNGDALYRMPFEAVRDGADCIETVAARDRIPAGTRICREGTGP
ncbi:MAG: hypothetical protein F4089_00645 [Gammaproteobacteria bacterium]|nr:hypothetical protein [Gammaproteobacteria bacterium]